MRRLLTAVVAVALLLPAPALAWQARWLPSGLYNDAATFHVRCPAGVTTHFRTPLGKRVPLVRIIALGYGNEGSELVRIYRRGKHREAVHDFAPLWWIVNEKGGPIRVRWRCR